MAANKLKRKNRSRWYPEEERYLLKLWKEWLPQLRATKQNFHIYGDIARQMTTRGFDYTDLEVKNKIHNLSNRYRNERRVLDTYGGTSSEWEHYSRIDSILGELAEDNSVLHKIEDEDSNVYPTLLRVAAPMVESCYSGESSSEEDPAKKLKTRQDDIFQRTLLNEIRATKKQLGRCIETMNAERGERVKLQAEMVVIERERNEILKELLVAVKEKK